MSPRAPIAALLLVATPASASTAVVWVHTDGRELSAEATASIVWHAMASELGHEALVTADRTEAEAAIARGESTSFYDIEVAWSPQVVHVDGWGPVGALAPRVEVREQLYSAGALHPWASWTTQGALALYEEHLPDRPVAVVALPQLALQDAVDLAVRPMSPPIWVEAPERVTVPVIALADEEYRAFYGADWQRETARRIERASAVLGQAGLRLELREQRSWASPDDAADLSALLDAFASQSASDRGAIEIAFTQQPDLWSSWGDDSGVEDVGRAYVPGTYVIVADQAVLPGQSTRWDVAEEGVAIAHEVLHALGLPHLERSGAVMSGSKSTAVHALAPSTTPLAVAAARTRFGGVDTLHAVTLLGEAAEAWLSDPDRQIAYITGNLAVGPGVPQPGTLPPSALSALTNVAIGRYYLDLAARNPEDPALLEGALAHSLAAVAHEPAPASTRLLTEVLAARPLATRSRSASP